MPTYEYYCPENQRRVEVLHGIKEKATTWGELCELAGTGLQGTPADAPVTKLLTAPNLNFPKSNSELKNMGFTKLVRRDKGVYENVTATDSEKRYMKHDDPSSVPNFKGKIAD